MSDETAIISDVNFNAEMQFCILNVVPRGIHEKTRDCCATRRLSLPPLVDNYGTPVDTGQ